MREHNDIGHELAMLARDLRSAEVRANELLDKMDNPKQSALLRIARDRITLAAAGVEVALEKHGKPEPEPEDEQPMEFETQRENSRTDDDRAEVEAGRFLE